MEKEILENHKRYSERKKIYQNYGFDIDEERKFVLDKAKPISGNILEVGTGKGHFALILAREGYRFTSIDISEEEQRLAKLNLKYFGLEDFVDLRVENAGHLSFEDKSFNVIFSVNTIHHLENPFKVMDELARVITPEGKIVLSDFTRDGFDILDKIHAQEGKEHHKAVFNLKDINRYFWEKGFRTEEQNSRFQNILIAYMQVA